MSQQATITGRCMHVVDNAKQQQQYSAIKISALTIQPAYY